MAGARAKTFAIALGGGGARGLAHIAALEAIDDLGLRPAAVAGTSIGALVGAAYASGMRARDIRRHAVGLAHDRPDALRRLIAARAGSLSSLLMGGFGQAMLIDAEKFCAQFLPATVPDDFSGLAIPLSVSASDLYGRREVVFSSGPLRPALAASVAIPGLVRPVEWNGRILVDGGATNPLPFDRLWDQADVVVAVDISGAATEEARPVPSSWECLYATVLVMGSAITREKLAQRAPDLLLRPNVGYFRALDFFDASAILRAAEGIKTELKQALPRLLA